MQQERDERVPTGVPGLDRLTDGGLVRGSLVLIEGRAGTGKTVLSNQIAFGLGRLGHNVLVVTLLSEGHGKRLDHLSRLAFFDRLLVGRRIHYFSGHAALGAGGLPGLFELLGRLMHEHRPALMVLDGVRGAGRLGDSPEATTHFMHDWASLLGTLGAVGLLLADGQPEPLQERSQVDGLIVLDSRTLGMRRQREVEVVKLRGSQHLTGRHVYDIDARGIEVFPRLEALATRHPEAPRWRPEVEPFGIAELDRMLGGGLGAASTTCLMGAPGVGKTLLGLSFLQAGLDAGRPAVYFGFNEAPERIVVKAERVGLSLGPHLDSGRLRLIWQPPLEQPIDQLAQRLLEATTRADAPRVFVDAVAGLRDRAAHPERDDAYFSALTNALRVRDATALFAEEIPLFLGQGAVATHPMSASYEQIPWLRDDSASGLARTVAVVKKRDTAFDPRPHPLVIGPRGLEVLEREALARPVQKVPA